MPGQMNQEEDLKAALLLSFVRFAEWPAGDSPVVVGIFNQPKLKTSLEKLSFRKQVQNRSIEVRGIRHVTDLKDCQVIYLGALNGKKLEELLAGTRNLNLLSIGESDRFLKSGGTIYIFQEDGRLNFEVNLAALTQSKINISSKLLRLRYTVRNPAASQTGKRQQ